MGRDALIVANEVSKHYGKDQALKRLSLEVEAGELYGLIGPDGAGKTTFFRIVSTLLTGFEGSVTVLGHDVRKGYRTIRSQLGYMPGRFSLYLDLTVDENIRFYAGVHDVDPDPERGHMRDIWLQIKAFRSFRAGQLSGGMKQKLALCCALIHTPKVLVLDEPTTGVDAVSRREFWDMLAMLRQSGVTILVATPYMDEASLCDRISLINQGEIMATSSAEAIPALFRGPLFSIATQEAPTVLEILRTAEFCASAHLFGQTIHYNDRRANASVSDVTNLLEHHPGLAGEIKVIQPGIEDTFMQLMEARLS